MNRLPSHARRALVLLGIFVLVLMVMDFNARLEELERLKKQARVIRTQATQAMQTQIALQTRVAYATSDRAVEDWARSEGHYVLPGDQLVIPLGPPGVIPPPSAEPTLTPTPFSNWQIWWNLFFGEQ